jgi:CspA family cold shock protein
VIYIKCIYATPQGLLDSWEVTRSLEGTVKRWLQGRGYGFITPDGAEEDIFVHHSEIGDLYELKEGQRVEFEVEDTERGPRATGIKILE